VPRGSRSSMAGLGATDEGGQVRRRLLRMGLTMTRGKHANTEALLALTRDLNRYTRFVCSRTAGMGTSQEPTPWLRGAPAIRLA